MKTVTMMKGLPGSGKSTAALEMMAKNPGMYHRTNKDSLRDMLHGGHYTSANEKATLHARDALIVLAFDQGKHVIVDDTNLDPQHEERLRQLARENNARFVVKDFTDVDIETCIENDLKRPRSVGERVIRKMWEQYLRPAPPVIEIDPDLPNAIICDLDGTLCHMGDRSPYDASTCERDALCEPVAKLLRISMDRGIDIIFMSGRSAAYRDQTERWLAEHNFESLPLFMRAAGDSRKDAIVKRELYEAHVKGRYNVLFVLDDRASVIRMWRDELGLTVFQVADGDF